MVNKPDVAVTALVDLIEGSKASPHPMSLTRVSISPAQFDMLLDHCLAHSHPFTPSRVEGRRRIQVNGLHIEEHSA